MGVLKYRGGYEYQLVEEFVETVAIRPAQDIDLPYISLTIDGRLFVRAGYSWDGPSGPTFHTRNFMRGALVHDALYQLMREGPLPGEFRLAADIELRRICREDGMSAVRAWWVYTAVRHFGGAGATQERLVLTAP